MEGGENMRYTYTCQDCGESYALPDPATDERCDDCREGVVAL